MDEHTHHTNLADALQRASKQTADAADETVDTAADKAHSAVGRGVTGRARAGIEPLHRRRRGRRRCALLLRLSHSWRASQRERSGECRSATS